MKGGGDRMKPKINIITLAVDDLAKSAVFYKDVLDLPTQGIIDGGDHILFEMQDNLSLVLYSRSELDVLAHQSNTTKKSSEFILSIAADSEEEVDSILKRAITAGGSLLPNQPKEFEWGYSGHFQDPDGHTWEIVYFK
jgi:predicted lactoylglutathione lyase